jgi:hypothetical protein
MVLMGLHAQEHLFPERMLSLLSMASVNPISGSSPRTWFWHESTSTHRFALGRGPACFWVPRSIDGGKWRQRNVQQRDFNRVSRL